MFENVKISKQKIKKLLLHFSEDITASKTAVLVKVNRNTVNRYFTIFREKIFDASITELKRRVGKFECDESYFGAKRVRGKRGRGKNHVNGIESFWSFAKRRLAKFNGIASYKFNLYLKECKFRFNYRNHNLYVKLLEIIGKI